MISNQFLKIIKTSLVAFPFWEFLEYGWTRQCLRGDYLSEMNIDFGNIRFAVLGDRSNIHTEMLFAFRYESDAAQFLNCIESMMNNIT